MQDNPERDELDSAVGVRKLCKQNSPYVLSCIDKRTREDCGRGSEVERVHSGLNGKGQFLRRNRIASLSPPPPTIAPFKIANAIVML